jgi:hypothetical protein
MERRFARTLCRLWAVATVLLVMLIGVVAAVGDAAR